METNPGTQTGTEPAEPHQFTPEEVRQQRAKFEDEHPEWTIWQSIKGRQWHCRKPGTEPPAMLNDDTPEGLNEQVCGLERTPYLLP